MKEFGIPFRFHSMASGSDIFGGSSTRTDHAVHCLRAEILGGKVSPGDRLAESVVGKRLGVSRVPVREALVILEREGLVEFSATGRASVKDLSDSDFEELYTLRLALEPLAARLAAPSIACDPSRLEANIDATRHVSELSELTRLDLDFHQLIIEASGNKRLTKLWISLRSELELWLGRLHRSKEYVSRGTREETVQSHLMILDCFRTQTPEECGRICRNHILGWREWLPVTEEFQRFG
jgi:DNA-binding GntR family transcriptional regulator